MKLTQSTVSIRLFLFAGIFILLNLLIYRYYFRLDFTADKRYTLSKTTRTMLKELEDPITVTAHFSEDLPPSVAAIRRDFRDLLYEYRSVSDQNVVFGFVNPNENEAKEQETQQQGIAPMVLAVRERDKSEQMRAYMGAVVKMGDQQEAIPFVGEGAQMEYNLSRSIKKLSATDKSKIGFVQGHGEPSRQQLAQAIEELSALYDVDTVSLSNSDRWAEFKTLAIIAPKDSFTIAELDILDEFLANGGGLLAGVDRVASDLRQPMVPELTTGLETWFSEKGVMIEPTMLTDAQCGQVTAQQQTPFGVIQQAIQFPYMPLITSYEDHPITQGLEAVNMLFVSPVEVAAEDSTLAYGTLAYTSQRTGTQPAPAMIDANREWSESDFPAGPRPVGIWLSGKISGDAESRMVVIGDGDFAVGQAQQGMLPPNNLNLLVNAIDWLTDDTGLIELRTRTVENRLIEKQLSDSTRNLVKYSVFLLPLLIAIGVGIYRNTQRKKQRMQWIQEEYSA